MARKVRDKDLGDRASRAKLKPSGKPYWRILDQGFTKQQKEAAAPAARYTVGQALDPLRHRHAAGCGRRQGRPEWD
jgi:hypothetical protein